MAQYLVANQKVVAEEFDGEVVLIDVEKGLYFSLQGAAIPVWHAFADGHRPDEIVQAYAAEVPGADQDALHQVIARMAESELLVPASAASVAPILATRFAAQPFATPVLEIYSDLAELIAIDPVHEVDAEAGWPLRPASFPDVA